MSTDASITLIKECVLTQLFANPEKIGEYGVREDMKANLDKLSALMERGSVGKLADTIAKILQKMADASPEQIAKPAGWLTRMLGGELEKTARYHLARKTLEELIAEAQGQAQGVSDTVKQINVLIETHGAEAAHLSNHIQAAKEFLDENPEAGVVAVGSVEFDRPRERLARRVANLSTLLASHEMNIMQMKLSRAQAVDLLDRFNQTVTVLVPVWRQHALNLITTKAISPDLVKQASLAHQNLMDSLSMSLKDIKH